MASLDDHLEQARSIADTVTAYAVDGSPEALLADAVRHLADAIAELPGGPADNGSATNDGLGAG